MAGPLPSPTRRRRNPPTIPTTVLPAGGRQGPIPRPPSFVQLGKVGRAWWRWAWQTPQAAAWPDGSEVTVARRAQLEEQYAESGDVKLLPEMRQLDDRLGLSPKAMAQLRWKIADVPGEGERSEPEGSGGDVIIPDRWRRSAAG